VRTYILIPWENKDRIRKESNPKINEGITPQNLISSEEFS
jgi:hypothetical protein